MVEIPKADRWILAIPLSLLSFIAPPLIAMKTDSSLLFVFANLIGSCAFVGVAMLLTPKSKKITGLITSSLLAILAIGMVIRKAHGIEEPWGLVGADVGFVGGLIIYCWLV